MALTDEDKGWIQELLSERLELMGTRVLTEFHKWASPFEQRQRAHREALRALDIASDDHEDRIKALENRPRI